MLFGFPASARLPAEYRFVSDGPELADLMEPKQTF
jgi:hypothetical protein